MSALFIFLAANAMASSVLRSAALPMFQNGDRSFLSHSTLGPVCSVIRALKEEPACNPAMLGEDSEEQDLDRRLIPGNVFGANFTLADDYDIFYKNRELIAGNDKLNLARNLLSQTDPVKLESSLLLWWRGETMAVSVQPMRLTYFSDVRNQSYPDLSIHAMQEQSVQAQMGGFWDENWRLGVQLRFLDRKFVYEEFNVFSALPDIDNYFQVKTQRALFVEPGVAYELNQTEELRDWRPLLSLHISQLGWLSQSYDEVPVTPIIDTGFSLSPPVAVGEWEVGLNYRYTTYVSTERKFRLGTLYRLGIAQLIAGIDTDQWDIGLWASLHGLGAGIKFQRVEVPASEMGKAYEESTAFELRYSL